MTTGQSNLISTDTIWALQEAGHYPFSSAVARNSRSTWTGSRHYYCHHSQGRTTAAHPPVHCRGNICSNHLVWCSPRRSEAGTEVQDPSRWLSCFRYQNESPFQSHWVYLGEGWGMFRVYSWQSSGTVWGAGNGSCSGAFEWSSQTCIAYSLLDKVRHQHKGSEGGGATWL